MKELLRKYRAMPYEDRLVLRSTLGLCFSAVLTSGKFLIGIFTDVNLCIIAVYTCAILLAKLQCIRGTSHPTRKGTVLAAVLLFFASVVYSAFMGSFAFVRRRHGDYGIVLVAGIFRTADRGYSYLNIKIIDFCIALIALLTAQIAILNFTSTPNVDVYNSFAGMGVGIFIALCALFIFIAPKVRVLGREHQVFLLADGEKNSLIDMKKTAVTVVLCRSFIYAPYLYEATVRGSFVDGNIVRGKSLWERMHIALKILCCILSEILVFVWLIGNAVFFFRSMDLPQKLQRQMAQNGFTSLNG